MSDRNEGTPVTTFEQLELSPSVLKAVAEDGYTVPTPIQVLAVPHVKQGRDLLGCAQTGTGKTAAFALPLIERLLANRTALQPRRCRILVLAPTRELASQIHESFRSYGRHVRLKSAVIYGGVGQRPQANAMIHGVDVLVATPGRLLDLVGQRLVDIRSTEVLVLDEADRMLDMGFIHDMRKIVAMIPKERQTLLFSATLPHEIREMASAWLRNPIEVKTAPQATPAETVDQSIYFVSRQSKRRLLAHLLKNNEAMRRVIVFARTKHGADKLVRDLEKSGVRAAAIHGNKSQNQRERSLEAFKGQHPPVLIATDIASRGIDVDHVSHVVNYELPHEPETYVHRIGRTGRAGMTGAAVSFCDREERGQLRDIERLLRKEIPAVSLPENFAAEAEAEPAHESGAAHSGERRPQHGHGREQGGNRGRRRGGAVIGADARPQHGHAPQRKKFGDGRRRKDGQTHVAVGAPAGGGAPSKPKTFKKKHRKAL